MPEFEEQWQDTWVNINGEFVKGPEASVSILDWSFIYGDGVFEGVSIADGKILKMEKHIDRLYRSAKRARMDLASLLTKDEMADRWKKTAERNGITDGYMRPLVSRGEGPMGISNNDRVDGPNVYVIPQLHRSGGIRDLPSARARLSSVRSPSPVVRDPRVKANHYMPNIIAKMEIADTDATVPIRLDDDGYVTEAAAANIFIISDGTVRTPDDQQILSGTTRATLIELLKKDKRWDISISDLTPYDLYTADECFLTGSIAGVKSITHLNGDPIGSGDIGSDTRVINEMLANHLVETGTPIQ
jgi:branched-chain amino acid aminotransferase